MVFAPMRVRSVVLLAMSAASLFSSATADTVAPSVRAGDPAFRYEGRFDRTDPDAPVVIWQASRIAVSFEGTSVTLLFEEIRDQVFIDATLDGQTTRIDLRAAQSSPTVEFRDLIPGRHTLELFKRSEAAAGTVRFRGLALDPGAGVFSVPAPDYSKRMVFFGDSITVGANSEDGAEDQWDDRATHNNAKGYATLMAQAFQADWRTIAVSGMGISEGYVPFTAKQIWDRVYPSPDAARADLDAWVPDLVFVNFGENDDSFTTSETRPFPPAFAEEFVALVRSMRAAWPEAQIVVLRGGMFGGARSERLLGPWQAAVAELERTDPRITHFVFTHWTEHHPRARDHRILADELIAWLRQQPFLAAP